MHDPFDITGTVASSVLKEGSAYLDGNGIEEPALNAELLLCEVLGTSRTNLRLNRSQLVTAGQGRRYRDLLVRRGTHEPLQYIVGETEFYGDRLILTPDVLIPRPETELLVETVLRIVWKRREEELRIVDLGTGCGNIAVALAKRLPYARLDAIDISPAALAVAGENIRHHRLEDRVELIRADMLAYPAEPPAHRYDLIVSNPPYVSESEFRELRPEIRNFEPEIAVTDKADGLTFYRRIASIGPALLTKGGAIVLEIAYNQGEEVTRLLRTAGYSPVTVLKDYDGNDRIVHTG